MWDKIVETIDQILSESGFARFFAEDGWKSLVMIIIACILLTLAIVKKFEPYLLIPIAVGMLLINLFPGLKVSSPSNVVEDTSKWGLFDFLYLGVKYQIYPCLIFLGIGATTDFGPLIANKKTMLLGGAAQIGIFLTFIIAIGVFNYSFEDAASVGIIAGADGPTAILVASILSEHLLPAVSIAAYSYMALVPMIQPPIIKLLTTKKERGIKMEQLRDVSKAEKILFPIIVMLITILIIPACAPLIGMLMLGNLIKEAGVVPHLVKTAANGLMYTVTILLGLSVGSSAIGSSFLDVTTLTIFGLGICAFAVATACGVLGGKVMCWATKGKVNPMIGAAGVSAVPMSARVVHKLGQKEDPENFLLMHAMGPNVAGVIGSAIAAGILLSLAQVL